MEEKYFLLRILREVGQSTLLMITSIKDLFDSDSKLLTI